MARPPCCLLAELAAEADRERMDLGAEAGGRAQGAKLKGNFLTLCCSASKTSIRRFVITEKAPTRAFFWLKAATTAFTFKTLLRHYA